MAKEKTLKEYKKTAKVLTTVRLTPEALVFLRKKAKKDGTSINTIFINLVDQARGL